VVFKNPNNLIFVFSCFRPPAMRACERAGVFPPEADQPLAGVFHVIRALLLSSLAELRLHLCFQSGCNNSHRCQLLSGLLPDFRKS